MLKAGNRSELVVNERRARLLMRTQALFDECMAKTDGAFLVTEKRTGSRKSAAA